MRKEDIPEQLSLDASEAQALENRIAESPLSEEDKKIMVGLIHFSLWMQQQLERAKLSIHRLKKLFGFKTEKKKTVAREPDIDKDETGKELAKHKVTAESLLNNRGSDSGKTKRNPEENHGRYGAADYPGCATEEIKHETLNAKTPCPDCAESETVGKLYRIKSGILIRLTGQPLIGGKCYLIEKWRCGVCGKIYRAEVPSSIANEPKHAPSCLTNIALGRYYFGLPFKRMEQWLKLEGIRLADATQWTKLSQMVESLKPLHKALEKQAAQGEGKFYDDTPNRIIDVMKRSYQETGRKGVYTTAIVSQQGERRMYLFYTSQRIAAENVYPLLEKDQRKGWFFTMSDASANNLPKEVSESLLARWILCFCLVHGRRKFYELYPFFKEECGLVLETISQVYQHEKDCLKQRYSAEERLAYHREHSLPVMEALRVWLNNKLLYQEIEANSGLGQAASYLLRHWGALTRFLHEAGVPLDNSVSEQALKVILRHRKNSLFYKTERGAEVGDILMSLIHTAVRNKVNPAAYLTVLQTHIEEVTACPEEWLPWCYESTFKRLKEPPALAA